MMNYTVKGRITRAVHDLKCKSCGREYLDDVIDPYEISPCLNPVKKGHKMALMPCNGKREIRLDLSTRRANVNIDPNIHPSERAAVYIHPQTGRIAWPGRVDVPMPDKYREWGYVKKEFETVRELDKFCKENKVVNEKSNFNNGNGVN